MKILKAPNKILSEPTTSVKLSELDEIKIQIDKMIKLLKRTDDGVGLAAPQVGINKSFFLDGLKRPLYYRAIINPEITYSSPEMVESIEGCLSIPGKKYRVMRPRLIMVKFINLKGEELHNVLSGYEAVLFSHEIDHLNGILISDKGEEYVESK